MCPWGSVTEIIDGVLGVQREDSFRSLESVYTLCIQRILCSERL